MKAKRRLLFSQNLAEIVGIIMGDGCLYLDNRGKYQTIIAFNKEERQYLFYVKGLLEEYFSPYRFCITEIKDEFLLRNNSVFVGNRLIQTGVKVGNKVDNRVTIPGWIMVKEKYIIRFLRGLFDTDGCVYRKYNNYAQIQIKLAGEQTIRSVCEAFAKIGYSPSRIQKEVNRGKESYKFYLIRQKEIEKFFEEVKPRNLKHVGRFRRIKNGDAAI